MRAAVIGYGYAGQLHLRAYQQAGIAVVAVAETNPDLLARIPDPVRRFADYQDLLNCDVDLVSVCVPTNLHRSVCLDAINAGKHVLLEKPIAATVSDAEEMIQCARQRGKHLFVGMTHRFYPEIKAAKRLVEEGAIGEVIMIRDSILEHFGFLNSPGWYLKREFAGGGTVLSSGIHLVDRVTWFANELPISVAGFKNNAIWNLNIEDSAQMSLGFSSGKCAQLSFGMLSEPHPLVCDLEVIGTRGSLIVHTWKGYEHCSAGGTTYHEVYKSECHVDKVLVGLRAEIEELCSAIMESREPQPVVEESTRALRVISAFYRAAETGGTERLAMV
jgi:UDP-N-acetyl-2-amino-2-deoxyglucuronate dehydrogenase